MFGASCIDRLYRASSSGQESGDYEDSYSTDFDNADTDADITYRRNRADIGCGYCYLVVRRDHNNGYYLYDLGNWDGQELIRWNGSTDIDQVSIWGGGKKIAKVTEPATLALFGVGLLALRFGAVEAPYRPCTATRFEAR